MQQNRREFLKRAGLAGAGVAGLPLLGQSAAPAVAKRSPGATGSPAFNMCGYAAPKIPHVRVGLIGIGSRGLGAVRRLRAIEPLQITALCDVRPERIATAQKLLAGTPHQPATYTDGPDAWKRLCARDDVDLVYICTPWDWHAPMALFAMEQGKHAATEIPAAQSLEECWALVETSERTRRHCMMLENCCYDFFELFTLHLARAGFFGEIVHGEGAYIHDLLELNFKKDGYHEMWRLKENLRNGNLYPMHGLGPIAQLMNINRGDRFDYLVSVSTDDFQMGERARELAAADPFYAPFAGQRYRGNMNTTTVRTAHGRTIMLQHDVTSPRPYSRIHLVSGTKAMAQKYPLPGRVSRGHDWLPDAELKALQEQHTPEIVRHVGELARTIGGHGGMDFMMDWRLIDCLRNGLPLDMDVYDAASWTAVGLLSEASVAARSAAVDVPDFTRGAWQKNLPLDVTLAGGGNTAVRS